MNYSDIINTRYSEPAAVIAYRDGATRVLDINDGFLPELWINISKDDFINADPEKRFNSENRQIFVNAVKKCAESGSEQIAEAWLQTFSDCCGYDRICLKLRLVFIENSEDGAIVYAGIRNITNERRVQDTLADVEYRYKQASEQINIYNWEYIIATKEMRPCYRCMRDLGLPAVVRNYPEPAIDMGIFPSDYADMYRDMMRRIDAGEPQLEADIPLTVGRVPFRVKYTTEFDEEGRPVKAFGSATLISETELGHIKLDNQIISSLAEDYRCIYMADFVKDTVQIIKQDGIFKLNENASCSELARAAASRLHEAEEENNIRLDDMKVLQNDLFRDSEKREFVYKDENEDRWIRFDYHVLERGSLGVDRLLVMVSVVDELRAQKMDADRLIAVQKEELEERQLMLLTAIDEANRASMAKTEFFSNMSHDIRTPMNAINGFSKLAVDEIDNREHLMDYLDKIVSASDHLLNLINDILDMSRIESGKMELTKSPVKLKKLMLECADMLRVKMDENQLDFIVDVEEMGDDVVECDKLRFSQIILNLLSNAYKFTPEGGSVYLTGRLLEHKDELTYEIRIRDTGIGMSEEFREHIWEAYSREDTETVRRTQGTGLGMVIVRNLVNLMQGSIEVESQPGHGSEFIIILPMKSTMESEESFKANNGGEALNRSYEGTTVLVVDDTAVNLKLAERVLSKYGFTVRVANNAINALQQIKCSAPGEIDIILMDVMMPVMDGLEAARRIRAMEDPRLADIPIIAMTANAFESDIKAAAEAGMNAHVPKPFVKEDLLSKINACLRE